MNLLELLCCALACLLLIPMWVVAYRQRDAWPYSWYPMFSKPKNPERVVVYRIAIQLKTGERAWWRPRYGKVQESLGLGFQKLALSTALGPALAREEAELVARLIHYVRADSSPTEEAVAICVMRRVATLQPAGGFEVRDELYRQYSLAGADRLAVTLGGLPTRRL